MSSHQNRAISPRQDYPEGYKSYCSIGDLAREFKVTLRTLRFYEDRGLLNPVRDGQIRLYDGRDRTRLQIILKAKQLGFTLTEIRDMVGSATGSDHMPPKLDLSRDQILAQIDHLERQRVDIELALKKLRNQPQNGLTPTVKPFHEAKYLLSGFARLFVFPCSVFDQK